MAFVPITVTGFFAPFSTGKIAVASPVSIRMEGSVGMVES
jgi:hypothetical protein